MKIIRLLVFLIFVAGCTMIEPRQTVVVAAPVSLQTPLSKVAFEKIDVRGTPSDIVCEINRAMKQAGYPLGLNIGLPGEGVLVYQTTRLQMDNVELRQIVDQMSVNLGISYWDNERLREIYFYDGERTSFFSHIRGADGKYTPAGPRQFMPPEFETLPLRAAYFDRTIEDLARERGLIAR